MSGKYRVWKSEVPPVKDWKSDNKQWPYRTLDRAFNPRAQHIILTIRNNTSPLAPVTKRSWLELWLPHCHWATHHTDHATLFHLPDVSWQPGAEIDQDFYKLDVQAEWKCPRRGKTLTQLSHHWLQSFVLGMGFVELIGRFTDSYTDDRVRLATS